MERVTGPYERAHFDIIEFEEGFNGDRYMFYFYCEATKMNHVYTDPRKSSSLRIVKEFTAYIKRLFGIDVKIFKLDNETTLLNNFEKWCKEEGIAEIS
ncbi:MAG: hypothetical protein MMC33_010823, partial [Icmadophila ericetorum]|nr:hypothetical protein [Icmadophila ericetorum]